MRRWLALGLTWPFLFAIGVALGQPPAAPSVAIYTPQNAAKIGYMPTFVNFEGSGIPGLYLSPSMALGDPNAGATDSYNLLVQREANYSGGTPFFTNSALLVEDDVSAGTTSFEWAARFILRNFGTSADGSQNDALQCTAYKLSTGVTFCANFALEDELADPTTTSVSQENDLDGFGTDAHGGRVNLDLWGRSYLAVIGNACSPASSCYDTQAKVLRFNTDAYTQIGDVIQFNLGGRGCAGNFINDVATSKIAVDCAGDVKAAGFLRPGQTTYANLGAFDASPQVGDQADITDAAACTANVAVATGGGTVHSCATVYNGAGWVALVTH